MKKINYFKVFIVSIVAILSALTFVSVASANHSWGGYHWARVVNPLSLNLGDNVTTVWDGHLATSSLDWNATSTILKTSIVAGKVDPRKCRPTLGRVEVCNSRYGNNGWLGIASVWVNGSHITQGTVKMNDTYFNTAKYNTPAWRQLVMCQEVGHTFGLDHQDEIFTNPNLGTCMDYTDDPSGTLKSQLDNQHPNMHDYEELAIIYTHLDAFTSAISSVFSARGQSTKVDDDIDTSDSKEWGREIKKSNSGKGSIHERDLDKGKKLFTFVVWAE